MLVCVNSMGQWTQKCALYMFGLDGVSVSYFHPLNSIEIECQKYSCIWIFFLLLLLFFVARLLLHAVNDFAGVTAK